MTNRRARRSFDRRRQRFARQVGAMLDAAHADGKPWAVHGLIGACMDCDSTASIRGVPGSPVMWADIEHDHSCPAYRGVTPWQVVP